MWASHRATLVKNERGKVAEQYVQHSPTSYFKKAECSFTGKGLKHTVNHSYFWGVRPMGWQFSLYINFCMALLFLGGIYYF